ncbi:MAG: (2Fe-2S)-binding protein [Deltaproteobacteria bacterium]|nr:(2Fe-2S)-binding protein [Deltaproteobacteria bacterium]
MIKITIDGREFEAPAGSTVLEAAMENGVPIPNLCYHPMVESYGACRLCLVEVERGGRRRVVVSCLYPVEEGLSVLTDTPEVVQTRKIIAELLLARCPENAAVRETAASLGVTATRFTRQDDQCILCGLCVRACEEIVGVGAITLSQRGTEREMTTPFRTRSSACIGCATCVTICPTNCIKLEEIEPASSVHQHAHPDDRTACRLCGEYEMEPIFYELSEPPREEGEAI